MNWQETLDLLEKGLVRSAQKVNGKWEAQKEVKEAILAAFKAGELKEFAGGFGAKYEVSLPMVVGVQAASKPPRYAPISKVRQVAQTTTIEKLAPSGDVNAGLSFQKMAPPVMTGHAEMISGSSKEVAAKIVELLKSKGLA